MISLTQELVRLIAQKPVNADDLRAARLFLIDAAANMIAGQNSTAGQKLLKWARDIAPNGDIRQLDQARKAFLLGALCHILEMDDLHRASVVHPGCVVAPVIFAMADGNALTAFLKGVEATTRVGMAVGPEHYQIWHNTATCGPFGSAIAAAHLLDLDQEQTVHALGNAGSQSAGFWQFLDTGAETKHLHAGRGAEAGLVAAQLARQGFTGAPDILEGKRGFFKATCHNPPIQNLLANADGNWQIHHNSIKPWPCCRHTHPAIQASLALHRDLAGQWQKIASIELETYQAAINLCDRAQVDDIYGAKFSLQHCIATALESGNITLNSFDADARTRSAVLVSKISVKCAPGYDALYPENWGSAVKLTLSDGRILTRQTSNAPGDPEMALSEAELLAKAEMLLDFSGISAPQKLLEQLKQLNDDGPVPDLIAILSRVQTPA